MWKKTGFGLILVAALVLSISGCKVPESVKLRCSAAIGESFADGVNSNTPVEITISATGGEAPYFLLGGIGTFGSTTTIQRSYLNNTEADVIREDVAIVNDNVGFTTQCAFSVTIHPSGDDDGDDDDDPAEPTLTLTASPAASVLVGNNITVTSVATELGSNITFDYSFSQSGVTINVTGNQAVFTADDNQAHQFTLTVRASGNDQQITKTIDLAFTTETAELNCTLSHESGTYKVGDSVPFTVTADTGEALTIISGDTGTDGTVDYLVGSSLGIIYSSTGTKMVTVKAKSSSRNVRCNGGNNITDTVTITSSIVLLTCTAFTDQYDYRVWYGSGYPYWDGYYYNSVVTWAEIPSGAGVGSVRIVGVAASNNPDGHYYAYRNDPLAKEVFFYEAGRFRITLTVEDSAGNRATCQTAAFVVRW